MLGLTSTRSRMARRDIAAWHGDTSGKYKYGHPTAFPTRARRGSGLTAAPARRSINCQKHKMGEPGDHRRRGSEFVVVKSTAVHSTSCQLQGRGDLPFQKRTHQFFNGQGAIGPPCISLAAICRGQALSAEAQMRAES